MITRQQALILWCDGELCFAKCVRLIPDGALRGGERVKEDPEMLIYDQADRAGWTEAEAHWYCPKCSGADVPKLRGLWGENE